MKRIVSVISTAEEANAAHRRIVATVQDAIAIGEFLTRQKAKLKHGEWLPWVKENLEFSRQTADNYRRFYENRDKLPSLSNLSLWNAYALTWNAYALTNGDKRSDSKVQPEKPEPHAPSPHDNVTLLQGNCLDILPDLPEESIQCCVTSPPYFSQRDYEADGQLGLEKTPQEYIGNLVTVFREVKRVMQKHGTLWLNLGDVYAKKSLLGLPWRVALALQADGWILRQEIIWEKSNCAVESVRDRPTRSHEQVFLLAKSPRYYYNADAIKEPANPKYLDRYNYAMTGYSNGCKRPDGTTGGQGGYYKAQEFRNKRSVWTVSSNGYEGMHFAVMPEKVIEPCILAGSRPGDVCLDPFAGSGSVAAVALNYRRKACLIELNPEYVRLIRKRLIRRTRANAER